MDNQNGTAHTKLHTVSYSLWISGIAVSAFCVLIQLTFFVVMSKCRKFNEKTLTQLTVTRLIYTISEFAIVVGEATLSEMTLTGLRMLYFQSDMTLLCWMYLFTKNMYSKIVKASMVDKKNFVCYVFSVFTITSLLSILYVYIPALWAYLFYNHKDVNIISQIQETVYRIYAIPKFILLFVNLLFFCKILAVAQKVNRTNRNVKRIFRTCAVSFVYFLVTSLEALVTDLLHYLKLNDDTLDNVFYVISSYQSIAITGIFLISVKSRVMEGLFWKTFCKCARETYPRFCH